MTSPFRQERRQLLEQERVDIDYDELKSIVVQTAHAPLSDGQRATLDGAIDTLARVQQQVDGGARIRDIRRFLGWRSEKTRVVLNTGDRDDDDDDLDIDAGENPDDGDDVNLNAGENPDDGDDVNLDDEDGSDPKPKKKKKKGGPPKKRETGRVAASDYTGATVVDVEHQTLSHKDDCPDSECRGKVYTLPDRAKVVRITGIAPLVATVFCLARLRCNLCGAVYTAKLPVGVGDEKYDATAAAMIGTLRYGYGLPHNRIEKLCGNHGIPMPSSTQWDVVDGAADTLMPVLDELVRLAAQGKVLTIDDTFIRVIELNAELDAAYEAVKAKVDAGELPKSALHKQRTGVCTTGIVSTGPHGDIVLFLTSAKHAGENFNDVLTRRAAELGPPIRMADALSRNFVGDTEALDANCLTHGRRQFVGLAGSFPDEVEYVLEQIGLVYEHDDHAKKEKMTDEERLAHHQQHSGPVMNGLKAWFTRQIDDRLVEPNSGLGAAIAYLDDHWERLTLFLRVAGAPLDSNVVERALKVAIQHRKNSLFYRSRRGAQVGDCFMSLIHTAERRGINSSEYLAAVLRHGQLAAGSPADWQPWTYAATMARLGLD